jgi:hypothetical protein
MTTPSKCQFCGADERAITKRLKPIPVQRAWTCGSYQKQGLVFQVPECRINVLTRDLAAAVELLKEMPGMATVETIACTRWSDESREKYYQWRLRRDEFLKARSE